MGCMLNIQMEKDKVCFTLTGHYFVAIKIIFFSDYVKTEERF